MEIEYHGWSGVSLDFDAAAVGFDLGAGTASALEPEDESILCVTHGHPDHCGLLQERAEAGEVFSGTVISSPAVVDHFASRGVVDPERAVAADRFDTFRLRGVRISTFLWEHMPLLPPGIVDKGTYLGHILSRPLSAVDVVTSGLGLPLFGPTLGFYVEPPDEPSVLNYAEGLHRLTDPTEVESVGERFPDPDVLLSAVEPEDTDAVPRWIADLNPSRAFIYEAHRPWREQFGLEAVDLADYADALTRDLEGIRVEALVEPGTSFSVCSEGRSRRGTRGESRGATAPTER